MTYPRRILAIVFFSLASVVNITGSAHAAGISLFELDKVPDLSGFLLKDGKMFAVFNDALISLQTDELYGKLLKMDLAGKKNCTKILYADSDKSWTSRPCISTRRQSDGSYLVDLTIRYEFPGYGKDEISSLKAADHVKERKLRVHFEATASKCAANVIARTYVPLDGTKQKPSRTGPITCNRTAH